MAHSPDATFLNSWPPWVLILGSSGAAYTPERGRSSEPVKPLLLATLVTSHTGLCDTKLLGATVQSGNYTRPGRERNNVIENEIGKSLQFF